MSLRAKILIAFLLLSSLSFYYFADRTVSDMKPRYREAVEEPLVDSAEVLAAVVAEESTNEKLSTSIIERALTRARQRTLKAKIYDLEKKAIDIRLYVTDALGIVVYDSEDSGRIGQDYSQWNDVYRTLRGEYGARSTHENPKVATSSVFFVSAPILRDGKIIGVLSLGKPAYNNNIMAGKGNRQVWGGALIVGLAGFLLMALLTLWITWPLSTLTSFARAVRDGKKVPAPSKSGGEIGELSQAFDEMRVALEGKEYVEKYVQTLTHELKSPLAAIRGAAEILQENPKDEVRQKFVANILSESARMEDFIGRLLTLTSLERTHELHNQTKFKSQDFLNSLADSFKALCASKNMRIAVSANSEIELFADEHLLKLALSNLIKNAIDFSPNGAEIRLGGSEVEEGSVIEVFDNGPGIPDYAKDKLFDRFYSLSRPDSGKRSSGIGLAIVREIAELHGGNILVANRPEGGAVARLILPKIH